MSNKIILAGVIGVIAITACKKDRTCSCQVVETDTKTRTPQNSAYPATTEVNTYNSQKDSVIHKVTKKEMMKDCQSKTGSAVYNYTAVTGYTSDSPPQPIISDVSVTAATVWSCKIK